MARFDIEQWCVDNIDRATVNGSKQIVCNCPFCGKKDKFYVDSESGKYICFSCSEAGKKFAKVISVVENISMSDARRFMFRNNVEFRRKKELKDLSSDILVLRQKPTTKKLVDEPLPKEFRPIYKNGKWNYPVYLKERGIKKQTAKDFNLGYAVAGRYANRIIIPIECPNGNSLTARDITGEASNKYKNPYNVDHGRLLLGWDKTPLEGDLTLVEGPLDAIKMYQHGIPSVALLGKVLHKQQLNMLFTKPKNVAITIMLDPEEQRAPYQVANLLLCWFADVYIAKLPLGVDPGSSTKKQALTAMRTAVKYTGNRLNSLLSGILSSKDKIERLYRW